MPRLFVVDTNVIVSGVLSFGRPSTTSLVLAAMLDGRVPFVITADLLADYRLVLLRPIVAERHVWASADIDGMLAELVGLLGLRARRRARHERRVDGDDGVDGQVGEGFRYFRAVAVVTRG